TPPVLIRIAKSVLAVFSLWRRGTAPWSATMCAVPRCMRDRSGCPAPATRAALIQVKVRPLGSFDSCDCNHFARPGMRHHIEGTTLFDGDQAQKGYALNRMCFSFNSAENREAFCRYEDAYCE